MICTSWYLISAEQDNLYPVRVHPEGTTESCCHLECTWSPVHRDSSSAADTEIQLQGNPGAAPAVGLTPNHPRVPVSPVCPTCKLVGRDTKPFPSPARGGEGKASPCQVPVPRTPTPLQFHSRCIQLGISPCIEKNRKEKTNKPQTTARNGGREMLTRNPCMQV